MTTLNISLPDSMRNFIEEKVAEGGYSTASEYIRQLVREDQKRAGKNGSKRFCWKAWIRAFPWKQPKNGGSKNGPNCRIKRPIIRTKRSGVDPALPVKKYLLENIIWQ
jgi:hypothetical protein